VDGGGSLWGERWSISDPPEPPEIEIPKWPEEKWPEFSVRNDDEDARRPFAQDKETPP